MRFVKLKKFYFSLFKINRNHMRGKMHETCYFIALTQRTFGNFVANNLRYSYLLICHLDERNLIHFGSCDESIVQNNL